MDIVVCGISHKSAPLEMLERLTIAPDGQTPVLIQLTRGAEGQHSLANEAALLCTCNRVELYAVIPDTDTAGKALAQFIADFHHLPSELLRPYIYTLNGEEAVRHLCDVACSLDSVILGESQILGQVRLALQRARDAGAIGPVLSALFRSAIRAGKRARTETSIGQGASSVGWAAVELAERHLGPLAGKRALLIGAGKTGRLTAQCLISRGVRHIAVANRTLETAQALSRQLGGRVTRLNDLQRALCAADIAISATDAPAYLVTAEQVRWGLPRRNGRPLVLVDIAVPRDIDPAARDLPGVQLYDLDDLKAVALASHEARDAERPLARDIAVEESTRFMDWFNAMLVTPAIVNLRQHAERIRQEEVRKFTHRLGNLSAHDLDTVDQLTERIMNRLLHQPTIRLKQHAAHEDGSTYAQALCDLFALDDGQNTETP